MTVCQLYDKKNSQRKNIKRATEKGTTVSYERSEK